MKFYFCQKVYTWEGQPNGHLTIHANGLFEALELLKLMVSHPGQWDLRGYE